MNTERLLILADALETRIPADRFDLRFWRESDTDTYVGPTTTDEALIRGCGTSACAVGWACALPELQAQGLTWDVERGIPIFSGLSEETLKQSEDSGAKAYFIAWGSVREFFEIDRKTADYLFDLDAYQNDADFIDPTPANVAARIRWLVDGGVIPDEDAA